MYAKRLVGLAWIAKMVGQITVAGNGHISGTSRRVALVSKVRRMAHTFETLLPSVRLLVCAGRRQKHPTSAYATHEGNLACGLPAWGVHCLLSFESVALPT